MFIVLRDTARIKELGDKIDKKTVDTQLKTADVSSLLSMTEDTDILAALSDLKEKLRFSDQIGCDATKPIEEQFSSVITEIEVMLQSDEAKEDILKKIKYASVLWNKRNTTLSIMR